MAIPRDNVVPGGQSLTGARDGWCCQYDVARRMATVAARSDATFDVSTGDSSYSRGLMRARDVPVARSWYDVYLTHAELCVPCKMTLGNHDHEGDVDVQFTLSAIHTLWQLGVSYRFETVVAGALFLLLILDTACW